MKALLHIAARSAWNRRGTLALVLLSIALATALLLALERLRTDIRSSFAQAVSGTDLVVGARGGPVQLLLYSVFHLGNATNNVSWASIEQVAALPQVKWLVPIALGDSHRGHRVVARAVDQQRRPNHHPLLGKRSRVRRHRARAGAADLGVVGATGGEKQKFPRAGIVNGSDDGHVGQVRATPIGIVRDHHIARREMRIVS